MPYSPTMRGQFKIDFRVGIWWASGRWWNFEGRETE